MADERFQRFRCVECGLWMGVRFRQAERAIDVLHYEPRCERFDLAETEEQIATYVRECRLASMN